MEIQEYISLKEKLHDYFINFIDDESSIDEKFNDLIKFIKLQKYHENTEEFRSLLHLISEINKNYHRSPTQIDRIEQILSYFEDYIKQNFSNDDLLNIFEKNPQILHFLINKNIFTIDESFLKLFKWEPLFVYRDYQGNISSNDLQKRKDNWSIKSRMFENYKYYFYLDVKTKLNEEKKTEIEEKLLEMDENIFKNFEKNCRIGENDSYICQLIRKDLIKEFIIYVNRTNYPIGSEIPTSIFETNPLLMRKQAMLIEYAAFYGSIQIFQYLRLNNVELSPSLWLYAIHGKNPDIIHLLEENYIKPADRTYTQCFKESIKCHHNDIAQYIQDNLMREPIEKPEVNFKNNQIIYGFHYYNFRFLKNYDNLQYILYYACLYDYFPIVKFLNDVKQVDLNQTII